MLFRVFHQCKSDEKIKKVLTHVKNDEKEKNQIKINYLEITEKNYFSLDFH
jgi:hypothetical protein